MPNAFYDPGHERTAKVDQLFTAIAPRYDLINDLQSFGLHRIWKRRVVKMAGARRGVQALDVCCGTGDIAILLARKGADVVGLDFNERMLAVALQRVAARGSHSDQVRSPTFLRGDAHQLPFADNSFDIVTVGYGLRNLASWQTGMAEMARVARPGGRIIVLEFGKPDNPLWRACYFAYLRVFVPVLGWMFCGNAGAYAYILESLKHYPAQWGVEAKMRELGLVNVKIVNLVGGVMSINYGEQPI